MLLAAQWWFSSQAIERLLVNQQQDQLQHDSEALLAAVTLGSDKIALQAQRLSPDYQRVFSGSYYAVKWSDQLRSSNSWWDFPVESILSKTPQTGLIQRQGPDGQVLLILSREYRKQGQQVWVSVAHDISGLQANLRTYQGANALLSLLALLMLIVVQRLLVIQSLRGLGNLALGMESLQRGEIKELKFHGPSEVMPVVSELNRLLMVVNSRLKRSRDGMGNLAHGLKTRLARLSQLAEHPAQSPEFKSEVQALAAEAARLIDRETSRLRVLGDLRPSQRIPVLAILDGIVQSCQKIHAHKRIQCEIHVDAALGYAFDKEDLYELLGNLVDNAFKWATARILISGHSHGLKVSDDGPGCSTASLINLSKRGFRADEQMPGSGLGLAIASDIANSYGAMLQFHSPGVLGGFDATLYIEPTASSA